LNIPLLILPEEEGWESGPSTRKTSVEEALFSDSSSDDLRRDVGGRKSKAVTSAVEGAGRRRETGGKATMARGKRREGEVMMSSKLKGEEEEAEEECLVDSRPT